VAFWFMGQQVGDFKPVLMEPESGSWIISAMQSFEEMWNEVGIGPRVNGW
jgi:hypothetical protein